MIHDKGAIHPTYLQLEGVLDKRTSDQIVVFSLEAFIHSS